jgi:predicted membrane channel-forming protein YqfA (hemolysin III family)
MLTFKLHCRAQMNIIVYLPSCHTRHITLGLVIMYSSSTIYHAFQNRSMS